MKCSIKKRTWKAIYRLLDRVSPVDYDCGRLCGAACCTCGNNAVIGDREEEMGIYLYPGEHLIHDMKDDWLEWSQDDASEFEFPDSWVGPVYFVRCKTPPICKREMRPLQCRTFPLKPYINEDGMLELIWNFDELPYSCPLIDDNMEVTDEFYQATYTVWSHLVRDPLIFDLVAMDSVFFDDPEDEEEEESWIEMEN